MIGIIDYGMGNLASVKNAFESRSIDGVEIVSDAAGIEQSKKLVLPGVGAFEDAMKNLRAAGLVKPIMESIRAGKPFLGICLGYQLLFERSFENGKFEGLGVFAGDVVRFDVKLPVPHMGWNTADFLKPEGVFDGYGRNVYFYFDHAYYPVVKDPSIIAAKTSYGVEFVSAVVCGNVSGAQFHPEKSHNNGLTLIDRFGRLS
jgi:glutamine amidotransferase